MDKKSTDNQRAGNFRCASLTQWNDTDTPQMGGFAGADLAIAVSNAGGLGQIGAVFDMKELSTNLEKVEQTLNSSEGVLPVGVG